MITKIFCTANDRLCLKNCDKTAPSEHDLSKGVIEKPWGYEHVIFQEKKVAVWRLFIQPSQATSLHCHLSKQTAMIAVTGQARCRTLDRAITLNPFDAVIIERGAFHSTESLSPEAINILEVDSPPLLTDLVRLEDKYGRIGQAYGEKIWPKEPDRLLGCSLSVETDLESLQRYHPYDIVALLDDIPTARGALRPGDILYVKDFLQRGPFTAVKILLLIRR